MKKIVILLLILFLTGCSKYVTCTINLDSDTLGYKLDAKYKIYYKGKRVTQIVKEENYIAHTKTTYKYIKESKELEYSMLSSAYGGYDYKMDTTNTGIKLKATINTNDLDVKKMVKDKVIDKYYTSGNEILLSGLKKHYESMSAICK